VCRDSVTVRRVVRVHELAVHGADLVVDERMVQGREHLHERELREHEGTKDAQPRRKSRFSCGAERLMSLRETQTKRYSSTA
jgi:hypothetical protein